MKSLDAETLNDPRKGKKVNKVALDLGLYSTRYDGKYYDVRGLLSATYDFIRYWYV